MTKKLLLLIIMAVAVTSFGIDPSHARRRISISTAKAAPPPAAKPAPAAASTRKDDARSTTHIFVAPRAANRPSNDPAPASTPLAAALGPDSAPLSDNAPAALSETNAPALDTAPVKANKQQEPIAPPARRHFVELNSPPPQPQRATTPPSGRQPALCFKTAEGKCGRIE